VIICTGSGLRTRRGDLPLPRNRRVPEKSIWFPGLDQTSEKIGKDRISIPAFNGNTPVLASYGGAQPKSTVTGVSRHDLNADGPFQPERGSQSRGPRGDYILGTTSRGSATTIPGVLPELLPAHTDLQGLTHTDNCVPVVPTHRDTYGLRGT
jgi:hypothetical protein